jgi:hypothetical protein
MKPITIFAVFVAALVAGLGAWQASGSVVSGIIAALLPVAGALPSPVWPKKSPLIPLLALALISAPACAGAEWRVVSSVRAAGGLVDRGIASAHKVKREACKKAFGPKTPGFQKCLDGSRERLAFLQWRRFGMPGLNTALISTVTTLTIYDRAAGEKMSWDLFVTLIKPAACGLSRAATAWKDLLREKSPAVLGIVAMIKGVSCAQ